MKLDDCYLLGQVIKTHGLKGHVTLHLDVDIPDDYRNLESVFLDQQGQLVPFFITEIQITGNHATIKFEEYDDVDQAKTLIKSQAYLPVASLPGLLEGGYYFHDLIGCSVLEDSNNIGVITNVYEGPNELLAVDSNGKEILIPLTPEVVTQVDIQSKHVWVSLPDGLIDLYIE